MTDSEKITMLKAMQEEQDEDVLSTYLYLAGRKIILRAFGGESTVTEVPNAYVSNQLEIAVYLISKRGMDYTISHSENGVIDTYSSSGVPEELFIGIPNRARVHG